MVTDEHGGAGNPGLFQSSRAIGENHDLCAGRRGGANRVNNAANSVVFVKVCSGPDHECVVPARCPDGTNGADVTFDRWLRKTGDFCRRELGDRFTDEVGRFAPSRTERESDVVSGDSRNCRYLGCGFARDVVRVGLAVVERVAGGSRHSNSLELNRAR